MSLDGGENQAGADAPKSMSQKQAIRSMLEMIKGLGHKLAELEMRSAIERVVFRQTLRSLAARDAGLKDEIDATLRHMQTVFEGRASANKHPLTDAALDEISSFFAAGPALQPLRFELIQGGLGDASEELE